MVSNPAGILYVVATPIGNLQDIGQRALQVLATVDCIAAEDTRHSGRFLRQHGIDTRMLSLHQYNEAQRTDKLVARLRRGQHIALISDAGTPLISDPGFPLVRRCHAERIRVLPVPGPSALLAALSVSGLPADRFRFEGFLPRRAAARRSHLQSLASESVTLVFYESSHRILACIEDMLLAFGGQRQVFLAREITKIHEELRLMELGKLLAQMNTDPNLRRGEFVILVAGAAAPDTQALPREVLRLLELLCTEMPIRQAVALAARFSGIRKNQLYRAALAFQERPIRQ